MIDPHQEAYDRGVLAGEVATRLAGHDKHFEAINGSLAEMVRELHGLGMAMQKMADQNAAAAVTVVATASALKDAEEARRNLSTQSWTPVQRFLAVLGTVSTAVATALGAYVVFHHG